MNGADEVAVSRILAGRMRVAEANEDDRDAAIVHLHTVDGMSAMEIATRLRLNHETSRRVLREWEAREARRALRRAG